MAAGRVFITHETDLDYSSAEQYGDLIPITSRDVSNVAGSQINKDLIARMTRVLSRFNAEADYLLVSGSPYVSSLCAWVLGKLGVYEFKMLRWSNQDRRYFVIQI